MQLVSEKGKGKKKEGVIPRRIKRQCATTLFFFWLEPNTKP